MKLRCVLALVIALAIIVVGAFSQAPSNPAQGSAPPAITILDPQAGAKLAQDFVSVRYELSNPNAVAGTPNFRVQLDSRDPVQTSSTNQQFTGLQPGTHNLTVWLVDANGTPITGSQASVQFILVPPAPPASPRSQTLPEKSAGPPALPGGGSPLPLLSVVGAGVLCGGLISALRTRSS